MICDLMHNLKRGFEICVKVAGQVKKETSNQSCSIFQAVTDVGLWWLETCDTYLCFHLIFNYEVDAMTIASLYLIKKKKKKIATLYTTNEQD